VSARGRIWEWIVKTSVPWKTCCFLCVFQAGVGVLLDITASHVSSLSHEDLNAVQDLLWLFYCQKLISVRNDCQQVNSFQSYIWCLVLIYVWEMWLISRLKGGVCSLCLVAGNTVILYGKWHPVALRWSFIKSSTLLNWSYGTTFLKVAPRHVHCCNYQYMQMGSDIL